MSKMHAKAPILFNFVNFYPVSTKFSMNIEHIILTNRIFSGFGIANFWRINYVTNLALKILKISFGDFINPCRRVD
jgi:hypothetical protein